MRIRFQGVRGGGATTDADKIRYGGNTSSVVITHNHHQHTANQHLYLLDAGTGLARYGAQYMSHSQPYQATLLLSHLQLYHIIGFQFTPLAFSPYCETLVIGPNTRNFAMESVFDHIMSPSYSPVYGISNLMSRVHFAEASPKPLEINGMHISATPFLHSNHSDSWGYRLSDGRVSVAYIMDARLRLPNGALDSNALGLADGVDLLMVGAFAPDQEHPDRITYNDIIALAEQTQPEKVIITQHSPQNTDQQLDVYQRQFNEHHADLNIKLAYEGLEIVL